MNRRFVVLIGAIILEFILLWPGIYQGVWWPALSLPLFVILICCIKSAFWEVVGTIFLIIVIASGMLKGFLIVLGALLILAALTLVLFTVIIVLLRSEYITDVPDGIENGKTASELGDFPALY